MSKRINMVTLLVGGRGRGKTTYIKKLIASYSKTGNKTIVIDTFDNPAWREYPPIDLEGLKRLKDTAKGTYRIFSADTDSIFEVLNSKMYNALVICEDASKYVRTKLSQDQRNLVVDSKQRNLDFLFVFHAWGGLVPPDLIRFGDVAVLFKTNERIEILQKIPNPSIIDVHKRVMEHPSEYHYEAIKIGS